MYPILGCIGNYFQMPWIAIGGFSPAAVKVCTMNCGDAPRFGSVWQSSRYRSHLAFADSTGSALIGPAGSTTFGVFVILASGIVSDS